MKKRLIAASAVLAACAGASSSYGQTPPPPATGAQTQQSQQAPTGAPPIDSVPEKVSPNPVVPDSGGAKNPSDTLSKTGGVIAPKSGVDPEMRVPPATTNDPISVPPPPPQTPGGKPK